MARPLRGAMMDVKVNSAASPSSMDSIDLIGTMAEEIGTFGGMPERIDWIGAMPVVIGRLVGK